MPNLWHSNLTNLRQQNGSLSSFAARLPIELGMSILLILLGTSVFLANNPFRKFHHASQVIDVTLFLISFQALTGTILGQYTQLGPDFQLSMSFAESLFFAVSTVLHSLFHAKNGFLKVFVAHNVGGSLARKLSLAALLLPVFFGWIQVHGEQASWFDANNAMLIRTLGTSLFLLMVIWKGAREITEAEQKRRKSDASFKNLCEALPLIVWTTDANGKPDYNNQKW